MPIRVRNPLLCVLTFLLLGGIVLARVLLCPRCGHEVEAAATICSHCQNVLLSPAEVSAVVAPAPVATGEAGVLRSTLEAELAAARAALEQDQPALAWLRARNLAGLLTLSPDAALVAPRVDVERKALVALRERERVCPVCKGERDRTLLFVTVNGVPSQQKAPGSTCLACDGAGRWSVRLTADQLAGAFAHAQRAFNAAQRERGWIASGGLWFPPGVTNLTVGQVAAARRAVAGPCETCRGLGMTGCDDCLGAGRRVCTDSHCVSGKVVCPDCDGTRRMRADAEGRNITRRCATCRQTGVTDCPTCQGRSYLTCTTCDGHGEERCESCKGTGEKSICGSCSGEGWRACKRCKGHGAYRDAPCPECRGVGEELCATCNGTGRGKR